MRQRRRRKQKTVRRWIKRKSRRSWLLRLLFEEPLFRFAVFGFVAFLVFLGLFLPKMWRMTPPDFLPVIKISGLDMVQAWSLRRTAQEALENQQWDDAVYTWRAAFANNPSDWNVCKKLTDTVLRSPKPARYANVALQQCLWMMKLTETNQLSLETTARVFEEFGLHDPLFRILSNREQELTPAAQAIYLKVLFNNRKFREFDREWQKGLHEAANDPELRLYRAAYLAGWGPRFHREDSLAVLEQAARSTELENAANKLLLDVRMHHQDVEGYYAALEQLRNNRASELQDHIHYWRMLMQANRKSEAIELAKSHSISPQTAMEVLNMANFLVESGERQEAIRFLKYYLPDFGFADPVWAMLTDLIIEEEDWTELRSVLTQIRQHPVVKDDLRGFSYYLEGSAAIGEGNAYAAGKAFDQAASIGIKNAGLGKTCAGVMIQKGHSAPGLKLLKDLEEELKDDPQYWFLRSTAGYNLKDVNEFLSSSGKAYDLQPSSPVYSNNYAAALLISRQHPQKAVSLTLQTLVQQPQSLAAHVNHALALLRNGRLEEARDILSPIQTERLGPAETTILYAARFELYYEAGEYENAWNVAERIDQDRLFPSQRQWLQQTMENMPPRVAQNR